MRRGIRSLTVVSAVLAVTGLGIAAPVQAGEAGQDQDEAGQDQDIVTARGSVAWFHDGDLIQACDARRDGISIEANYRLAGDQTPGRVLHVAGAGNCDKRTWDKSEGQSIEIRMCYRDGIIITTCSDWQSAEA